MSNVLVTGGAGFIGREVVRQLRAKGHTVRIADNLSKKSSYVSGLQSEFVNVDLSDKKAAEDVFSGIDICINLAAKIGGIGYFHSYAAEILSENNRIYSSTFEAAVKQKIKRMVFVSSSMVYESATRFPSREEDVLHIPPPVSAYGFSKLIGEQYCFAFWEQYKLPYTIVRPFNAYGIDEEPGDEVGYAHVIPDLLKKIFAGQYPLEILGNGGQVRCFTHVRDLAAGIIALTGSEKAANDVFNVADPNPVSILQLAKLLWKFSGRSEVFKITSAKPFPYDIQKRIPDVQKVHKTVGWKPTIPLERGLQELVAQYKERDV